MPEAQDVPAGSVTERDREAILLLLLALAPTYPAAQEVHDRMLVAWHMIAGARVLPSGA